MGRKSWKQHELAVANFFLTHRNQDHLTKASQRKGSDELGSDVIVKVADWLKGIGKKQPREPWNTIIVECKYAAKSNQDSAWLYRFWEFYDKIPKSVDKNVRIPVMYMADGWAFCRLSDFYAIYRHFLASKATGTDLWLKQHWAFFYMHPVNVVSPEYFKEWVGEMTGEDGTIPKKWQPALGVICLGSSLKRHGPGGGRVVAFNSEICWR
jgi:hypothetical protein